jgi:hypothetical protein
MRVGGRTTIAVALLMLAALAACRGDYRFHTRASYEAPRGGYRVDIDAEGIVRSGADLAEEATAQVQIGALPPSTGDGIHLVVAHPQPPGATAAALAVALRQGGFTESPPAEIEEVGHAIEGALLGPKATLMDGQTRQLRVVKTDFAYD